MVLLASEWMIGGGVWGMIAGATGAFVPVGPRALSHMKDFDRWVWRCDERRYEDAILIEHF